MAKKKPSRPLTLSEQLRAAIVDSGLSVYRIAKDAGVQQATLQRFMAEQRDMRLSSVDAITAHLGLHLVKRRPPR
jgi:DNA-binding phage protein